MRHFPAFRLAGLTGMLCAVNRIVARFEQLRRQGQKGLVIYIGAGDPHLAATLELALGFEKAGVDVVELGVPFSDPLADGVVNQLAAQRGLASGTTPPKVLAMVMELRKQSQVPIVLYIYFNLLHRVGLDTFIRDAAAAGVDGLLVLDLPPEESANYESLMAQAGLCPIYLIAPTTPEERIEIIAPRARGFIYYVSREGVTGMQSTISTTIGGMVDRIRKHSPLPIAIGFGVSNAEQARQVASYGDAVVVGSAVVNRIAQHGDTAGLADHVSGFVQTLSRAIKSSATP